MLEFTVSRRALRGLASCAPAVDVRDYLLGVHVRADARGIILEATDGHALGRLRVSPLPVSTPVSVILPLDVLKTVIAGGKKTLDDVLTVTVDGAAVTIADRTATHALTAIDGRYPDTDHVTRKAIAAPVDMAQFNPALMERLHACIKTASGADNAIPHYSQRGATACIVTASELPEFIGLVMPWRADNVRVPAWVEGATTLQPLEPVEA
jgi:hypothetical protein